MWKWRLDTGFLETGVPGIWRRAAAGRASQGFKFIAGPEATRKAGQNGVLPAAVGRTPEALPAGLEWGTLRLVCAVVAVIYV
jgi:hypothetical protein